MKILVLTPPSPFARNVVRDVLYGCWCKGKRIGGGTVPPYFQLLAATVLRQDGHDTEFLDAQAEGLDLETVRQRASGADVVVIQTSTMTVDEDAKCLAALKADRPDRLTVAFGSHATFMPRHTLARDGIDCAVLREPEFVVRDIVRARATGNGAWKEVRGIAFRNGSGEPHQNPPYPLIQPLDQLPCPDLDLLPKGVDYFNPLVRRPPFMTTVTSRGCPAKCSYCTAPYFYGEKVRFRTPPNVLAEMRHLRDRGFREVYFRDEVFTIHRPQVRALCSAIVQEGLQKDLTWICNARVDMIDRETISAMKEAGCRVIKFGVESGDQGILDAARKGATLAEAVDAFRGCAEEGIETHAHFMVGMPGDDERSIEATIRFAERLDPTTATFGICTPYPGTPLFEEVARKDPSIMDGARSDLSRLHTTGEFNHLYASVDRDTLESSVRRAYRRFYLRARYWAKTARRIRGFDDLMRFSVAGSRVVDFAFRGE
ncbi:MAG: radical SAM protein [Planctomycetes bacterium]|nr:radical SAM protein [Planctomycetota bacterium]